MPLIKPLFMFRESINLHGLGKPKVKAKGCYFLTKPRIVFCLVWVRFEKLDPRNSYKCTHSLILPLSSLLLIQKKVKTFLSSVSAPVSPNDHKRNRNFLPEWKNANFMQRSNCCLTPLEVCKLNLADEFTKPKESIYSQHFC